MNVRYFYIRGTSYIDRPFHPLNSVNSHYQTNYPHPPPTSNLIYYKYSTITRKVAGLGRRYAVTSWKQRRHNQVRQRSPRLLHLVTEETGRVSVFLALSSSKNTWYRLKSPRLQFHHSPYFFLLLTFNQHNFFNDLKTVNYFFMFFFLFAKLQ